MEIVEEERVKKRECKLRKKKNTEEESVKKSEEDNVFLETFTVSNHFYLRGFIAMLGMKRKRKLENRQN